MEYKLRVCVEMLNYAFHETDLRASETKKALAVFFDEETIEQATAILRGNNPNKACNRDGVFEEIGFVYCRVCCVQCRDSCNPRCTVLLY